jgi:hypothetical protein
MHWTLQSAFGYISGQTLSSVTILGSMLYVTANKGLYASTDGGAQWRLVKPEPIADGSILKYFGALDFAAYGDSAVRMWEDHTARIVFTAGGLGGLYRWSSGL